MVNIDLERAAAQAVYAAHLLSRAAHDPGPWTVTWGPVEVPAERIEVSGGISFVATFPEACWLRPPEPNLVLRCNGEVVAVRPIAHPGDCGFMVTWDLAAAAASLS